MADSEEKDKPQADLKPLPEGTSLIVVRTKEGTTRELLKKANGQFARKPKPLIPTEEFTRQRRKRMMRINSAGLTEDMAIVEELLDIIHTPIETDKKSGMPDAKFASAKIKAAETLWLFTGGKPDPSEREMDKLERQPITAYFVQAPALPTPEVVDGDKPKDKATQPTFAEVTGIVTNPKK